MIFGNRQKLKSKTGTCLVTCNDATLYIKLIILNILAFGYCKLSFKSHIDHVLRKVNLGICVLH